MVKSSLKDKKQLSEVVTKPSFGSIVFFILGFFFFLIIAIYEVSRAYYPFGALFFFGVFPLVMLVVLLSFKEYHLTIDQLVFFSLFDKILGRKKVINFKRIKSIILKYSGSQELFTGDGSSIYLPKNRISAEICMQDGRVYKISTSDEIFYTNMKLFSKSFINNPYIKKKIEFMNKRY